MANVTFAGSELEGLDVADPAASVRLLIPSPGARLIMPQWTGNEFLLGDGQRPIIRTFTPRRWRPDALELDLEVVLHERGATSNWVGTAERGDVAAISGTGRGYSIDPHANSFLLAGDQTAIPAISQLIEAAPVAIPVHTVVEIVAQDARQPLPSHPRLSEQWVILQTNETPGSALLPAILNTTIAPGTKVWAAGEAAAMHQIRRHLFDERGLSRSDATVRGYWKHGR